MLLQRHLLRTKLELNDTVDVTDPGYDSDVWCRMTVSNMKPGNYRCCYYTGHSLQEAEIEKAKQDYEQYKEHFSKTLEEYIASEEEDIKSRCFIVEIQFSGRAFHVDSARWKEIGTIGVDGGAAGFFPNKPDFTQDEWSNLCDWMYAEDRDYYFKKDLGFWVSSGYGDGVYAVYAIEEEGKTIALKICF